MNEYTEYDDKYGVMTKKSNIPGAGNGLFATKDFRRDEIIIPYRGEVLNKEQKEIRYPNNDAEYLFQINKNTFIDATDPKMSNLSRYANHKPFSTANAKLTTRGNIKSKKAIKAGEEIFVTYGKDFRL
jgi:hypothetical protein